MNGKRVKNQKSSVFIATSLAFALANVAIAQNPQITNGAESDLSNTLKINWKENPSSSGIFAPQYNGDSGTATQEIKKLIFKLGGSGTSTSSFKDGELTSVISSSDSGTGLKIITSGNQAIESIISTQTNQKDSKPSKALSAVYEFNGKDTKGVSLYGDFIVGREAKAQKSDQEITIQATFAGDLQGSLKDWHSTQDHASNKSTYIFKNGASVTKDVLAYSGVAEFTFGDSTSSTNEIGGKLEAYASNGEIKTDTNVTLTFKGSGAIKGGVYGGQNGTGSSGSGVNSLQITFEGNKGKIEGGLHYYAQNASTASAKNTFIIKNADVSGDISGMVAKGQTDTLGANNKFTVNLDNSVLTGNIADDASYTNNQSVKTVVFKGGSGNVLIGDIISYNVGASNFGTANGTGNFITFEAGNMKGNILADSQNATGKYFYAYNSVTFGANSGMMLGQVVGGQILEGNITARTKPDVDVANKKARNDITLTNSSLSIEGANGGKVIAEGEGAINQFILDNGSKLSIMGELASLNGGENKIVAKDTSININGDLKVSGKTTFDFKANNAVLTISQKDDPDPLGILNTSSGNTAINFGVSVMQATIKGSITTHEGETAIIFNRTSNDAHSLILTGTTISSSGNGKNTITFKGGSGVTLTDAIFEGSNEIKLEKGQANGSKTLSGKITTNSGNTAINFGTGITAVVLSGTTFEGNGTNNIDLDSSVKTLTINGSTAVNAGVTSIDLESRKDVVLSNSTLTTSGEGILNLNFKDTALTISGSFKSTGDGNTMNLLGGVNVIKGASSVGSAGKLIFAFNGNGASLEFQNASGATQVLTNSQDTLTFSVKTADATLKSGVSTNGTGSTTIDFAVNGSTLNLKGDKNSVTAIQSSTGGVNNVINLTDTPRDAFKTQDSKREQFRVLEIGGSVDKVNFVVYANADAKQESVKIGGETTASSGSTNYGYAYSDRVIVDTKGIKNNGSKPINVGVIFDKDAKLEEIKYSGEGTSKKGNIAIATIKTDSGYTVQALDQVLGFNVIGVTLTSEATDKAGKKVSSTNDYTTYFVADAKDYGTLQADQTVMASAFTLNYDLYLANFNSLNKRMGELRDNGYAQGVWARVFNGAQTNDFGLGSKNNYTTIQAGYDYAFGLERANNYLGFALSYAMSSSTSLNSASTFVGNLAHDRKLDNISSNAVEVAFYNSYVQDSGWYNDTIMKFSYVVTNFSITDPSQQISRSDNKNDNFALTFSDEFGYRFKLGEEKEWYIDPQFEFGVGYFSQSDFKQTLENVSQRAYLDGKADAVMALRARLGSSFGYNFTRFTKDQDVDASLYVGVFYEYDYLKGGEITLKNDRGGIDKLISILGNDQRGVVNLGTNVTIKDSTRLYFDFEKSFGGKISTDYQINVGVRYSFGEGTKTPLMEVQQTQEKAPLKIKDETK